MEAEGRMDRRIDAHIARTQFGQIMGLAIRDDARFVVDRRGEPAVVIMSVRDFIRTCRAATGLTAEGLGRGAKRRGLDALAPSEIDVEIVAQRQSKKGAAPRGRK